MKPLFPRLLTPDDRAALVLDGEALTYRQLARACRAHLDRLGAKPGDRVAVWTHSTIATPVILAAHAAGGIVSVPLDPKLGEKELAHILEDAEPTHVIDPRVVRVETDGAGTLADTPADATPMLTLYTSGTTGPPKGAVLTRRNVAVDLDALADAWGWSALDTVVHALPLFHVHKLVLGLFGSLRIKNTLA